MRILVTGGAGFIGSHVVDVSLDAGHELAVLDDLSTGHREHVPKSVPLHELDVRDRDAIFPLIGAFRPEVVVHQAAQPSVAISVREPLRDAEINVIGSIHLLDACVAHGVSRFVFASSGGTIYGEVPAGELAGEESPVRPTSPYGIAKAHVENLLAFYRAEHGLDSTSLRYANVYGPRQNALGECGVVATFIDLVLAAKPVLVYARREPGDEGCVRDYLYVADAAKATLLAIEGRVQSPALNLGTGVGASTRELLASIFQACGREVPIEYAPRRPGDLERNVLDPSGCLRALGRLTSLRTGLELTVKARRSKTSTA